MRLIDADALIAELNGIRYPDPKAYLLKDELICLELYEQGFTTYKIAKELHCTRGKVQSMVKELIRRGVTQKRDRLWVHS